MSLLLGNQIEVEPYSLVTLMTLLLQVLMHFFNSCHNSKLNKFHNNSYILSPLNCFLPIPSKAIKLSQNWNSIWKRICSIPAIHLFVCSIYILKIFCSFYEGIIKINKNHNNNNNNYLHHGHRGMRYQIHIPCFLNKPATKRKFPKYWNDETNTIYPFTRQSYLPKRFPIKKQSSTR